MKTATEINHDAIVRIEALMKDMNETMNSFAVKTGINPSNFNRKMKGKIPLTLRDYILINKVYGISVEWLDKGTGEKFTDDNIRKSVEDKVMTRKNDARIDQQSDNSKPTPYYDVDFALGFDEMFNDSPNVPAKYISIPSYNNVDFWCRTTGTSMQPVICSGDVIALREIADWQSFLPTNEVYAIITTNAIRTVKVIRKGSDEQHFTLHAYNDEFSDQEIDKASILKVFKVVGALKTL